MSILSTSDGLALRRKRNTAIGFVIAGFATAYPCLAAVSVWIHYRLAHAALSKQTTAKLIFLTFPMCLGCAFSLLVFIADGRGKKRAAGIAVCLVGTILNALFVISAGITV
jgi:Trk-type K+ transport system membrane component